MPSQCMSTVPAASVPSTHTSREVGAETETSDPGPATPSTFTFDHRLPFQCKISGTPTLMDVCCSAPTAHAFREPEAATSLSVAGVLTERGTGTTPQRAVRTIFGAAAADPNAGSANANTAAVATAATILVCSCISHLRAQRDSRGLPNPHGVGAPCASPFEVTTKKGGGHRGLREHVMTWRVSITDDDWRTHRSRPSREPRTITLELWRDWSARMTVELQRHLAGEAVG